MRCSCSTDFVFLPPLATTCAHVVIVAQVSYRAGARSERALSWSAQWPDILLLPLPHAPAPQPPPRSGAACGPTQPPPACCPRAPRSEPCCRAADAAGRCRRTAAHLRPATSAGGVRSRGWRSGTALRLDTSSYLSRRTACRILLKRSYWRRCEARRWWVGRLRVVDDEVAVNYTHVQHLISPKPAIRIG